MANVIEDDNKVLILLSLIGASTVLTYYLLNIMLALTPPGDKMFNEIAYQSVQLLPSALTSTGLRMMRLVSQSSTEYLAWHATLTLSWSAAQIQLNGTSSSLSMGRYATGVNPCGFCGTHPWPCFVASDTHFKWQDVIMMNIWRPFKL